MSINQFIRVNSIKQIDAIIMRKKLFGMVDHYVIYLGVHNNQHTFVANYLEGVKIIPNYQLEEFLQKLVPERIDKFFGDRYDREEAFDRAVSRIGEKSYNYFKNNCEHFKNWVHFGENYSSQVKTGGNVVALGGAAITALGVMEEDGKKAAIGIGLTALGLILRALAGDEDEDE